MGSDGNVSGGGGGAYRLVKSRSLNFFPIKDRALSTCCCVPERDQTQGEGSGALQKKHGDKKFNSFSDMPRFFNHPLPLTHPLCDRSETPVCKAGWRCRSLLQSSASGNSRISLVSLLTAQQDAGKWGQADETRTF